MFLCLTEIANIVAINILVTVLANKSASYLFKFHQNEKNSFLCAYVEYLYASINVL